MQEKNCAMTYAELEKLYRETDNGKFKSFISAVKKLKTSGEMKTFDLSNNLCKIADNEAIECRHIGLKATGMTSEERQRINKAAKLVALCITYLCETRSRIETRNKALLLLEYISYLQSGDHNLIATAAKLCSFTLTSPGYSISQIEMPSNIDILANGIAGQSELDMDNKLPPIIINKAGSVTIKEGIISISSTTSWENSIQSFSDHDGHIEVRTRNTRDEKLKASDVNEASALDEFAENFLTAQTKTAKNRRFTSQNTLEPGEKYTIELEVSKTGTRNEDSNILYCRPLGMEYEGDCIVRSEELVKGLYTEGLIKYIYDYDCVEGAVLVERGAPAVFSIKDAYIKYAKAQADKDCVSRRVYSATVVGFFEGETREQDRVILISDKGYGGLMIDDGTLEAGDIVELYTKNAIERNNSLFINMAKPFFDHEEAGSEIVEDDVLRDFIVEQDTALRHLEESSHTEDKEDTENCEMVTRIGILLMQSKDRMSIVRYRDILCSAFLFNLAGDTTLRDTALSGAEYLNRCLLAAEGKVVRLLSDNRILPNSDSSAADNGSDTTSDMEDSGDRTSDIGDIALIDTNSHFAQRDKQRLIVEMLASLGKTKDMGEANAIAQKMLRINEPELARLYMAHSLVGISNDDIKGSRENLRRKICDLLGVGDHFRGEVGKGGGKYGKGELENVEFKSSYVFSNKDGKPDIVKQGRGQVFEAVCGFLNKDGGTVYVGVNDSGDPYLSDTYGLKADITWFDTNFNTVNCIRQELLGHKVPQPKDLDSYCRFLNYEVELYFKPTIKSCISISPTEDLDAIRITVKPSEYEIATLYTNNKWTQGCAYIRVGEETKPMARHEQEQRLMKLRRVGKVEKFILTLTEAIDKKLRVTLKNYASGNSNSVQDRVVVPINLVYNNENLWAYDICKGKCQEFRLERVEDIEIGEPYPHTFDKGESDVFRWVNPSCDYHIKLKLNISALNNLKEEYSNVKNLPESELYQASPQRWILDTHLHGLGAVRRFYLGLADQIEILDTEDSEKLKADIREFIDKNLKL